MKCNVWSSLFVRVKLIICHSPMYLFVHTHLWKKKFNESLSEFIVHSQSFLLGSATQADYLSRMRIIYSYLFLVYWMIWCTAFEKWRVVLKCASSGHDWLDVGWPFFTLFIFNGKSCLFRKRNRSYHPLRYPQLLNQSDYVTGHRMSSTKVSYYLLIWSISVDFDLMPVISFNGLVKLLFVIDMV